MYNNKKKKKTRKQLEDDEAMAKRLESEGEKEFASSGVVTITTITTALEMRQRDKGDLFDSQNVLRNLVSFSFSFSFSFFFDTIKTTTTTRNSSENNMCHNQKQKT